AFISAIIASKVKGVKAVILLDGAAKMSEHQKNIVEPSLKRLSKKYNTKNEYMNEIKSLYNNLDITWDSILQNVVEYEVKHVGNHWENKSDEIPILNDFNSFCKFNPVTIMSEIQSPVLLIYAEG